MTLSHFYRANLSAHQLRRAKESLAMRDVGGFDGAPALFVDVDAGEVHQDGLALVMSIRLGELRRERGFFVND